MTSSVVEVRTGDIPRTAIVVLHDTLDVHSAPLVRECFQGVLAQGWTAIIVDLHDVEFIDSTGLGVLIGARRRSQDAGVKLVLARPSRATHRLLAITGMRRHFTITKALRPGTGTAA
ncbi:MAG TPA: STAS domain-containing protein [Acidimicrobiales bacterium]|jgi:anti-sigma B factor antagonist